MAWAINDMVEAAEHPQAAARGMVMDVKGAEAARDGMLKLIAPVKFGGDEIGARLNPPMLDKHTDQVLGEVGYTAGNIVDLRDSSAT